MSMVVNCPSGNARQEIERGSICLLFINAIPPTPMMDYWTSVYPDIVALSLWRELPFPLGTKECHYCLKLDKSTKICNYCYPDSSHVTSHCARCHKLSNTEQIKVANNEWFIPMCRECSATLNEYCHGCGYLMADDHQTSLCGRCHKLTRYRHLLPNARPPTNELAQSPVPIELLLHILRYVPCSHDCWAFLQSSLRLQFCGPTEWNAYCYQSKFVVTVIATRALPTLHMSTMFQLRVFIIKTGGMAIWCANHALVHTNFVIGVALAAFLVLLL